MKLPDKIFGISTEEAYRKYLEESKKKPETEEPRPKTGGITTSITGINLGDYVFLPRNNIYVAKEKSHLVKKWNQAHKKLHKEKARMITLREFVDFLLLLKQGTVQDGLGNIVSGAESQAIYKEITEVRDPWRAEYIDAYFSQQPNASKLNINYNHRTVNCKLQPQNTESLEQYLTTADIPTDLDLVDWLNKANKHGLPQSGIKSGKLCYWSPRNGKVTWFGACSSWAYLICNRNIKDPPVSECGWISTSSFGVRAVRDKV